MSVAGVTEDLIAARNGDPAARDRAFTRVYAELKRLAAATDLIDLDAALSSLATLDARLAEVAELHLFAGLEFAEIAVLRATSERTVFRDWRKARAVLSTALGGTAA